jgi:hypothetical protein
VRGTKEWSVRAHCKGPGRGQGIDLRERNEPECSGERKEADKVEARGGALGDGAERSSLASREGGGATTGEDAILSRKAAVEPDVDAIQDEGEAAKNGRDLGKVVWRVS